MASSKTFFLLFALLFALALLVSTEAAASEESTKTGSVEGVKDAVCHHGCCRWFHHRCVRCCRSAEEVSVSDTENNAAADAHCRHGCCRWFHGRCIRCCPSA
ncbi:hypothetical protein M9H77_31060 [Catharanthus roseus]|uniref:CYC02 protein n=2 Tax=Catharanthus roseus TaxID=4058 RepID=CYC02_CATRO|nr:RecName: Full=CYC02 protein [Catharanthus roseus]AAA33107.1 cyc02 [Catharanthus roseus]KAI5653873.1 hypothetical protein M9H77_31060 [Catharanthus roseus]BAA14339.1 cyc02 [Catharanthus roseus]